MESSARREVLRTVGLGAAVGLAGCSGLVDDSQAGPPRTVPGDGEFPDYVRPCGERIWGQFDPNVDTHLNVGPLTFALVLSYWPTLDDDEIAPGGESLKARLVIDPGVTVTLVVPDGQREHVALDYNPNNWYTDGAPLDNAQWSVRFPACGTENPSQYKPRQYNGGIVVTDTRCVSLDVWVADESTPRTALLPIGTECSPTSIYGN